jgi:hypothetical protein
MAEPQPAEILADREREPLRRNGGRIRGRVGVPPSLSHQLFFRTQTEKW